MHRVALVIIACFVNFSCSGVLFGWPALIPKLRADTPGMTESSIHNVYLLAGASPFIAPLVLGPFLDKCGPRICCCVCSALIAAGFFIFGMTLYVPQHMVVPMMSFALFLIGFGGPGVQNSLFHISNLFPNHKGMIITIIAACLTLSFSVFLILVGIESWTGWKIQECFTLYSSVIGLVCLVSFLVFPDKPFKEPSEGSLMTTPLLKETERPPDPNADISEQPLKNQLRSTPYKQTLCLFTMGCFWFNFFIATLHSQALDATGSEEYATQLSEFFVFISPVGILVNPFVGWTIDYRGFDTTMLVCLMLGILMSMLQLLSCLAAACFAFIAYQVFLFTYTYSFIATEYGFRYYGTLIGVIMIVASIVNLLQVLILQALTFHQIYLMQLVSFVLLLAIPLCNVFYHVEEALELAALPDYSSGGTGSSSQPRSASPTHTMKRPAPLQIPADLHSSDSPVNADAVLPLALTPERATRKGQGAEADVHVRAKGGSLRLLGFISPPRPRPSLSKHIRSARAPRSPRRQKRIFRGGVFSFSREALVRSRSRRPRSYSDTSPTKIDEAGKCRRRKDLFPVADDITVRSDIDIAYQWI